MYLKIQTNLELIALVETIQKSGIEWLAVDTEFFRETTYYPVLGLIQMATLEQVWVIDALSCGDLSPLKTILENPNIKKIFHAGEQDWSILKRYVGAKTWPYLDTQLMAAFAKLGASASLESLASSLLNLEIDKSQQKTDWVNRPLTDAQLAYAAKDAFYVASVYPILDGKLQDLGRSTWVFEEMQSLLNKYDQENYSKDWLKLCVTGCKWPDPFYAFELAKWREDWAKKLDLPRRHVLADAVLEQVLQKKSVEQVAASICLPEVYADLKILWQNLQNASVTNCQREHLEEMVKNHHQIFSYEHRQAIKKWQRQIKAIANTLEIPAFLLLNKQQLYSLVHNDRTLITGWRLEYLSELELWQN